MMNTIIDFISGKPLEFVSPYSLEETRHRLKVADASNSRRPQQVTLQPVDDISYKFHIKHIIGRNLIIESNGMIQERDEIVYVRGNVRINQNTLSLIIILALGFSFGGVVFMAASDAPQFLVPSWLIVVAGGLIYSCKKGQDELYQLIGEILGKSKKKIT